VSAVILGRFPGYTTLFDVGKRRVFGDVDGSSRTINAFFGGEIGRVATTASHPANITLYDLVPPVPTCEDIFVITGSSFEIGFTSDSNVIGRPGDGICLWQIGPAGQYRVVPGACFRMTPSR
jgi:hypothetical protein